LRRLIRTQSETNIGRPKQFPVHSDGLLLGRIASAEPVGWSVYTICGQSHWTGAKVEGPDEAAAMERAAANSRCRSRG
jgi:hypothetical protein